jgi:thioredoxin-related protein
MRFTTIGIAIVSIALVLSGCGGEPEIKNPRDVYNESLDGHQQIVQAMAQANVENKRVLITWGGDWCLHCRNLDQLMSETEAIQTVLNDHYIKIKIDVGRREKHMELAKDYGADLDIVSIPHMSILNTEGTVIDEIFQETYIDDDADFLNQHHPEVIAERLRTWTFETQ